MTIKQAIKILKKHQKWRLGDKRIKMVEPWILNNAINVLLNYADTHMGLVNSFAKQTRFK